MEAARLLQKGYSQSEVARRVGFDGFALGQQFLGVDDLVAPRLPGSVLALLVETESQFSTNSIHSEGPQESVKDAGCNPDSVPELQQTLRLGPRAPELF